jgi:hypothetical protein
VTTLGYTGVYGSVPFTHNKELAMKNLRRIARPISLLILTGFLSLTLHVPAANAALIGTETVIGAAAARDRIHATLAREEVKQALVARGVSPADVQARVEALTDDEAAQLAAKLDQLPAGGDALGVLLVIFLVLLLTDILGYTDIFPFVKKPAKQ